MLKTHFQNSEKIFAAVDLNKPGLKIPLFGTETLYSNYSSHHKRIVKCEKNCRKMK